MAKPKTKRCAFDVLATECVPGIWEWDAYGIRWRWCVLMGLNTSVCIDYSWIGVVFWGRLQEAVIYSLGYALAMERMAKHDG